MLCYYDTMLPLLPLLPLLMGAPPTAAAAAPDWEAIRTSLIEAALGALPPAARQPDSVVDVSESAAAGGATAGVGPNVTALTWEIREQGPAGGMAFNATVFHSLNTSGTALADYPNWLADPAFGRRCDSDSNCSAAFAASGNQWHSVGQAAANGDTGARIAPVRISDTLVLYHNGHETHWGGAGSSVPQCARPSPLGSRDPRDVARCWLNYDTTLGWLNELGYDAMEFYMPLRGPNNNGSFGTQSHSWFGRWQDAHCPQAIPCPAQDKGKLQRCAKPCLRDMRFFLEPVLLAVNYAKALGYKRIAMVGLSGGGWTTTVGTQTTHSHLILSTSRTRSDRSKGSDLILEFGGCPAAALDVRIGLSIPVAGSIPFEMRFQHAGDPYHDIGDYEQLIARPMYRAANYTQMYALAALGGGGGRQQLQILHELDACCFGAGARPPAVLTTRHAQLLAYNRVVQAATKAVAPADTAAYMCTAATIGNVHEVRGTNDWRRRRRSHSPSSRRPLLSVRLVWLTPRWRRCRRSTCATRR